MTTPAASILGFVFAAPAFFVAGILLVGVPILIHILNRRRYKVVQWAAMEYLMAALRKNRRRLRFEQWLLLAARCAVMVLIGLALARPMGCSNNTIASLAGERTGLHVFVIDNSASMSYEAGRPDAKTHLQQAKVLAKGLIDRLSAGGESVVVVTASAPAVAVVPRPTYNLDDAKAAVDRIEQTYGGTDLAGALERVRQIADESPGVAKRTLHLLTDSTRSAFDTPGSGAFKQSARELSKAFRVTYHNLGRANQANASVTAVRPAANLITTRFNADFTATAKGFGNVGDAILQWKLDDRTLGGGAVRLSSDTPPQTLSNVPIPTGGPHVLTASLQTSDRFRADDARHRTVNVASDLKVLVVEGDRGVGQMAGSAAFLALALAPPKEAGANDAGGKTDSYVAPEVISDLELGNKVLGDYRAVILTNVSQIQPSVGDALAAFVRQGGTLLMYMGEQVNPDAYTQVLLPRGLLAGPLTRRVSVGSDQKGFVFDFKPSGNLHPFMELFRGEEKSGLDTAQVFTYVQQQLPPDTKAERVLNYVPQPGSEASDPAITVHALGAGRVIFFSTTANADWTTLPVKLVYVSLMHELVAASVPAGDAWMNLSVGQPLELPTTLQVTAAPTLTGPANATLPLTRAATQYGRQVYRSAPLSQPGVYVLATGERRYPVSVNVPAEESDIRTLDAAGVKAALGDIDAEFVEDQLPVAAVAQAEGRDFGWTAMVLLLGLLAAECFMAMRFGHQATGRRP
jgi:hypothetical protein